MSIIILNILIAHWIFPPDKISLGGLQPVYAPERVGVNAFKYCIVQHADVLASNEAIWQRAWLFSEAATPFSVAWQQYTLIQLH